MLWWHHTTRFRINLPKIKRTTLKQHCLTQYYKRTYPVRLGAHSRVPCYNLKAGWQNSHTFSKLHSKCGLTRELLAVVFSREKFFLLRILSSKSLNQCSALAYIPRHQGAETGGHRPATRLAIGCLPLPIMPSPLLIGWSLFPGMQGPFPAKNAHGQACPKTVGLFP